jgi:hypothetical protein
VGVRGLPTEFATARSQSVRPESGAKLAKTLRTRLDAQVKNSILRYGPRDMASCVLRDARRGIVVTSN